VKIFLRPGEILVVLFAGSAVTAGRFTTGGTNEFTALTGRDFYLLRQTATWCESQGKQKQAYSAHDAWNHVLDIKENRSGKPFQKRDHSSRLIRQQRKVLP
jgi:hypothetical protein